MTAKCISTGGYPITVNTPGSASGIPVATAESVGVVSAGNGLQVDESGRLEVAASAPVDDLVFDQPDDYSEITAALMSVQGQYNELLASLREAGILKVRE